MASPSPDTSRSTTPPPARRSVPGEALFLCTDAIADSFRTTTRKGAQLQLVVEQLDNIGTRSIGLIIAAGIATGAVMAMQFGNGLERFGGALYVPEIVALSIFRELAPVLVGLLLAGRIGSSVTSELASMAVTEQIDAIRALGDSPQATLVMPRLVASMIAFPVLTLLGNVTAMFSAMFVCWSQLSIAPLLFLSKVQQVLTFADLWTGLVKSMVFAAFISTLACWKGLNTAGGTRGVGLSTTWIVVRSSIFILVADYFLSRLFIMTVLKFYA